VSSRKRQRPRRPDAPPGQPAGDQLAGSTVIWAGTVVVVTTAIALPRIQFLALAVGPAIDLILLPPLFRLIGRPYRSPGAPLWSACLAVVAMIPAIGTFHAPEVGLPFTAAAALPAMALGFLGWRRPLGRIGRYGVGVAVAALAISGAQFLLLR
jgi:hypothetical protein